jgi:hypothetical protein
MASAKGIIAKLDAALRKVNLSERTVYKRTITRGGGDALTGRSVGASTTDVKMDPPPAYERLQKNAVGDSYQGIPKFTLSSDGSATQSDSEYQILLSPTAISLLEVVDPDVSIVFKDAFGREEVFKITDFEPQAFQGQTVTITAYLKSVKRPAGTK